MKYGINFVFGNVENLGDLSNGHAGLEILKDRLQGHAGARENPPTAHFIGYALDGRAT